MSDIALKDLDKISSHNKRVLPMRARYIGYTFKTSVLSPTGHGVEKSQTEWEGSAIIFLALQRNLVLAVSSGEGSGQSSGRVSHSILWHTSELHKLQTTGIPA